jgi:hypothetical protein
MVHVKNMFWLMLTPLITALACWLIWEMLVV